MSHIAYKGVMTRHDTCKSAVSSMKLPSVSVCCRALHYVAVRCIMLQCVALCCSVLHYVAVCCIMLQCVAQCVSVCTRLCRRRVLFGMSLYVECSTHVYVECRRVTECYTRALHSTYSYLCMSSVALMSRMNVSYDVTYKCVLSRMHESISKHVRVQHPMSYRMCSIPYKRV